MFVEEEFFLLTKGIAENRQKTTITTKHAGIKKNLFLYQRDFLCSGWLIPLEAELDFSISVLSFKEPKDRLTSDVTLAATPKLLRRRRVVAKCSLLE